MSGGVDSSTTAALLKETGYEVTGISMQLWCEERHNLSPTRPTCCSREDIDDARQVCYILGIPFYVLNLEPEFQASVVTPFCQDYARGWTPNPCLLCNQQIKFGVLLQRVLSLGVDYLATGHYARIEYSQGKYHLLKGVDPQRDQSYFLYMLGQRELEHLLFPLGSYTKPDVRRRAAERGLPVSGKAESRDLCFVPEGDYRAFLASQVPATPGDILDTQGNKLGRHRGITHYTVGQRWGLGLALGRRLYVVRLEPAGNRVVVGSNDELYSSRLFAEQVSFVSGEKPYSALAISAKIRYKSPEAEAILCPRDGNKVEIQFRQPQWAITPGQAVVFYQGEEVLGGGIITGDEENESSLTTKCDVAQSVMG